MARLEYDNSAFLYFAIGILISFLIPLSWMYLRALVSSDDEIASDSVLHKGRTSVERKKLASLEKERASRRNSKSMRIRGVLLALGWTLIVLLYRSTGEGAQIEQWDPYLILGIPKDANTSVVKKAYRNLAKQYHPDKFIDKTPDDVAYASMMFEKVSKAHEVLTDDDARKNYEEFGNPDGKQSMEVGIGLPNFLLEKENHNLVLVIYLLILVILIPGVVVRYYSNSKLFGDKLIRNDSYSYFAALIDKSIEVNRVAEILALAAEFRDIVSDAPEDIQCLEYLKGQLLELRRMPAEFSPKITSGKYFEKWPGCERAHTLLHVYLNREADKLTPSLKLNLSQILMKSQYLVPAMMDIAITSMNLHTIQTILSFDQHLSQAMWYDDNSLAQLPHFSRVLAKFSSKRGNRYLTLEEYIQEGPLVELGGKRKGYTSLSAEQIKDVETALEILPRVEVNIKFGVVAHENVDGSCEFEEGVCEGDIVTALIEITRTNVAEGDSVAPVHAPYLPFNKAEEWTVLFAKHKASQVFTSVTLKGTGRIIREKIKFPTKGFVPVGKTNFDFYVMSNSYVGYDKKISVELNVEKEGTFQPAGVHAEDLELDNQPSVFEEIYGTKQNANDSDFDSDNDETDAAPSDKEAKSNNLRQRKGSNSKSNKKEALAVDDEEEDDKNK